jgi:hypothetical protein
VTITPEGTAGTVVSGTLYLDDSSFIPGDVTFDDVTSNGPEGSDLAAFSYTYTIG